MATDNKQINYRCKKCGAEYIEIGDYYKDFAGILRCPINDCFGVVEAV